MSCWSRVERLVESANDADFGREREELSKALDWAPRLLVQGCDAQQVAQIRADRKAAWRNWAQQPGSYHCLAQVTADKAFSRLAQLGDLEALQAWLVCGNYPSYDCYARLVADGYRAAGQLWLKYNCGRTPRKV